MVQAPIPDATADPFDAIATTRLAIAQAQKELAEWSSLGYPPFDLFQPLRHLSPSRRRSTRLHAKLDELKSLLPTLLLQIVPDEVLTQIFACVTPYRRDINSPTKQSNPLLSGKRRKAGTTMPPGVLTHVCGRWRRIVLATPTLWGVLPLIDLRGPPAHSNPLLDLQLSRARQYIPLCIYAEACGHVEQPTICADTLTLLKQRVEQWQDVVLKFDSKYTIPDFSDIQGRFLKLRSMHITQSRPGRGDARVLSDLFRAAPMLEDLTLLVLDVTRPKLPRSLKRFHGYYHCISDALWLLSTMPQLVSCKFTRGFYSISPDLVPPTQNTVIMPCLTTLELVDWWERHNEFIKCLILPALETLAMPCPTSPPSAQVGVVPYHDLMNMITLSHASLRRLTLSTTVQWPEPSFIKVFFSCLPNLEFLRFADQLGAQMQNRSSGVELLSALCQEPNLLPTLKRLEVLTLKRTWFSTSLMQDLVRTRSAYSREQNGRDSNPRSGHARGYLEVVLQNFLLEVGFFDNHWFTLGVYDGTLWLLGKLANSLIKFMHTPLPRRTSSGIKEFNAALGTIWKDHRSYAIPVILRSSLHTAVMKIIYRGGTTNRLEASWVPKAEVIIQDWKRRSAEYFLKPHWFDCGKFIYWTAGKECDIHVDQIFWKSSSRTLGPNPSFQAAFLSEGNDHDPFLSATAMPLWEYERLVARSMTEMEPNDEGFKSWMRSSALKMLR